MSSFSSLHYHVVFSTKHRGMHIRTDFEKRLYAYLAGVVLSRKGYVEEIGGVEDHIHLLAKFSPKFALSDVVRDIKANGSRWINDQGLTNGKFGWQKGYAAFTVSQSQVAVVQSYVRNQRAHHQNVTFRSEYVGLLNRHEIQFEPKYLFEAELCG